MKNSLLLLLILALAFSFDAYSQRVPVGRLKELVPTRDSKSEEAKKGPTPLAEFATVYPSAVPVNPNFSDGRGKQYGSYYTDDPFEKVKGYYIKEVGSVSTDKAGNEVFNYKASRGDYDIVEIHTSGDKVPKGVYNALRELKQIGRAHV